MEENKINDGEVREVDSQSIQPEDSDSLENNNNHDDWEENSSKGKSDFYIELVLFLILGVLLGIAVKTEAVKKITIGYNDYQMKIKKQDYDVNKMQSDVLKKQEADNLQQDASGNSDATDLNNSGQNNSNQGGSDAAQQSQTPDNNDQNNNQTPGSPDDSSVNNNQ